MNCPGHMVLFASRLRSYRELPLRYAEAAPLHRNERAGTLHGLTRVRHVTQDDAHIFCTREQIEDEIFGCLDYAKFVYDLFELESSFELSTRPENRLGTDEEWDFTEGALRAALDRRGLEYTVNAGRRRVLRPEDRPAHARLARPRRGRWAPSSSTASSRSGSSCRYVGADNTEHVPYVIHRALMGSFERFIGILIEHYAGAFPFWLAPVQIRVLPVGEGHREAAAALADRTRGRTASRSTSSDDTVGKRIRNAEVEKIPFVVVYGDKESDEALAIREHGGAQETLSLLISGTNLLPWSLASRGGTVSHLLAHASEVQPRFNRCRLIETFCRCMPAVFVVQ